MGGERRKFERHPIKVPVKLKLSQKGRPFACQTLDLSEGGFLFLAPREINTGTSLEVRIPVENRLFKLTGAVAYCLKDLGSDRFRIGVAFKETSNAFRAKLAEEILRIQHFRDETSRLLGKEISEDEAAQKWIAKYGARFSEIYHTGKT
jgi:hypothetical protein